MFVFVIFVQDNMAGQFINRCVNEVKVYVFENFILDYVVGKYCQDIGENINICNDQFGGEKMFDWVEWLYFCKIYC